MRLALTATLLLLGLTQAKAHAESTRPVVVELFTSQGCSSCPPADALLTELARNPNILPLAFHVTYWNNLGWRDPFSLDAATDRQRAYQRSLRTDTIYTPQMVVEGQTDVIGSDRAAVAAAIARANTSSSVPLTITSSPEGLAVRVGAGQGEARILLVGYDSLHKTSVTRGENAGRSLPEANIVRSLAVLGNWNGQAIALSSTRPASERVAVLLQAANGHILGAAIVEKPPGVSG
jgi:hypothetical protein